MTNIDFALIHRYGLFISAPLIVAGAALIVYAIMHIVRVMRRAQLLSLPLVGEQEADLPAGRLDLYGEGPLFTSRFAFKKFEIVGVDGTPVTMRRVIFRTSSSGFTNVHILLRVCYIPKAGRYIVRVTNLGAPQPKDSEHHLEFKRPHFGSVLVGIIGILLGAGLLIGDLVWFLLRLIYGADIPVQ